MSVLGSLHTESQASTGEHQCFLASGGHCLSGTCVRRRQRLPASCRWFVGVAYTHTNANVPGNTDSDRQCRNDADVLWGLPYGV